MKQHNRTLDELSQMIRTELTAQGDVADIIQDAPPQQSSRESLQISPTENYLEHQFRGWTFFPSPLMCGGLITADIEENIRRTIHCGTSEQDLQTSIRDHSIRTEDSRSPTSLELEVVGGPTQSSTDGRVLTRDDSKEESCWEEHQDDQGRTYYHNTASNQTQWTRPTVLDPDTAATSALEKFERLRV